MEDKINNRLEFIKSRFSAISFEIVHNCFSPTLKHFIIKDTHGEKGFGSSHDIEIAIEKSYSEYVERKSFFCLNQFFNNGFKTSNGFAAHTNYKESKISSVNEIIERDAFLISWHGSIPPYWLTELETFNLLTPENKLIFKKHFAKSLSLKVGIIAKTNEIFTCIAKVNIKSSSQNQFYIDTKADKDIFVAINGAVESISFFSHYISKGFKVDFPNNVSLLNSPIDHFLFYLNNNIDMSWYDKGNNNILALPLQKMKTYQIPTENILQKTNLERVVTFSEAENFQDYYCGKFARNQINLKRFENVLGPNFKLNRLVHPLS